MICLGSTKYFSMSQVWSEISRGVGLQSWWLKNVKKPWGSIDTGKTEVVSTWKGKMLQYTGKSEFLQNVEKSKVEIFQLFHDVKNRFHFFLASQSQKNSQFLHFS